MADKSKVNVIENSVIPVELSVMDEHDGWVWPRLRGVAHLPRDEIRRMNKLSSHMETCNHRLCSQRNESSSERRFGSRSALWLGLWFELRAFTCIANAVPITIRICALRGNILFPLRSPRWLTHAWLQRAFPKCTRTNHVQKELCVHMS